MVHVAILDNGIIQEYSTELQNAIYINENGMALADTFHNELEYLHGTICYSIIKKYSNTTAISVVRICDENGEGGIDKLKPAFEWCLLHNVNIVNISMGSTHFKDKNRIRKLVNHYANKGIIIVAAASNNGYITYPASFTNVISVICIKESDELTGRLHTGRYLGSAIEAPAVHHLSLQGKEITSTRSNSFAAPFVTSTVAQIMGENLGMSISELKKTLYHRFAVQNNAIQINEIYYCFLPDWIENAYLPGKRQKSKANYYFQAFENCDFEEIKEQVDTIIVEKKEDFEVYSDKGKHMVYLGQEFVETVTADKFTWSRHNRIWQIEHSKKCNTRIDIPVILISTSVEWNEFQVLSLLRQKFNEDDYNVYASSFEEESALYDFEYLPYEFLKNKDMHHKLRNFLAMQIDDYQSDVIILVIKNDKLPYLEGLGLHQDLTLVLEAEESLKAMFVSDTGKVVEMKYTDMNTETFYNLYNCMLNLLLKEKSHE